MIKLLLTPLPTNNYFEQIQISSPFMKDDWYPTTIVHIDTFWTKDGNSLYNSLKVGVECIVSVDPENFETK